MPENPRPRGRGVRFQPRDLELNYAFSPLHSEALELAAGSISSWLPPYGRVLHELLTGGSDIAVGAEEAELAWRIVTPVIDAWKAGSVPMEEYPAGSQGP